MGFKNKIKNSLRIVVRIRGKIRAKLEKSKAMKGVIVVSFPRSGRSWFRLMLNQVGLVLFYSHDKSNYKHNTPYNELDQDKSKHKDEKVIFIARDPRDVTVSGYFWMSKRKKKYNGELSDFIRDERYGIRKVIEFYRIWDKHKNIPANFLLVKYEDMHKDTLSVLKKVLNFLEIDNIDDEQLKEAVHFCKLSNLQKIEKGEVKEQGMDNRTKEIIGANKKVGGEEGLKTRKGKVGGYVDYLNKDDISYCNKAMHEMGCPWYGEN